MTRKKRAKVRPRKRELGEIIYAQTVQDRDGKLWWFECTAGWSQEDGIPPGAELHGPFNTQGEATKDQRLVLLGPQCKVTEGGMWDPNWERKQ